MDQMNLPSILLVSLPEQILLAVTVILLVARFDLIKPSKGNIMRIAAATVINTAFVVSIRWFSVFFLLNAALYVVFISAMYVIILKVRWHETLIATLLAIVEFYIVELLVSIVLINSGLNIDYILKNDLVRIACSLPIRLIEILIIAVIYKIPAVIIDLKPLSYATGLVKRFTLISTSLFIGLMLIANIIKMMVFDPRMQVSPGLIEYLITNTVFAAVLLITVMVEYFKFKRISEKEKNEYLNAIMYIEALLEDGNDGIIKAKETINIEKLRWGGKYGEK